MSTEDLDQTDLQSRDFTVPASYHQHRHPRTHTQTSHSHENTRQIKLDLETDIDVCPVDRRTPPKRKPTVRNLVETGPLGVRQLLVPHRLFETGRFLPEETLPCREICSLEEGVLQDTFHTAQCGDDVDTVVVELPEFAVVALGRPPEGIARYTRGRSTNDGCKMNMTHCFKS